MDLSLSIREEGEFTVVVVAGEIDIFTAPKLREQLMDVVSRAATTTWCSILMASSSSTRPASGYWWGGSSVCGRATELCASSAGRNRL